MIGFLRLGAAVLVLLALAGAPARATEPWRVLEKGLALGVFDAPKKSRLGDSKITVVRIDPRYFEFRLLTAALKGGERRTAGAWARRHGLVAAINAGMFQKGRPIPVGFTKVDGRRINGHVTRDKAVFAFGRVGRKLPRVQIIDRDCQSFKILRRKYRSLLQSIRMIDCRGRNRWSQQNKQWSTAAIAMDKRGRVLLIHCRSPYSVHDLIVMLLALPLDIKNAMYLEGGPEATLYLKSGNVSFEKVGSFETSFMEHNDNRVAWPLPNVIGVMRR